MTREPYDQATQDMVVAGAAAGLFDASPAPNLEQLARVVSALLDQAGCEVLVSEGIGDLVRASDTREGIAALGSAAWRVRPGRAP